MEYTWKVFTRREQPFGNGTKPRNRWHFFFKIEISNTPIKSRRKKQMRKSKLVYFLKGRFLSLGCGLQESGALQLGLVGAVEQGLACMCLYLLDVQCGWSLDRPIHTPVSVDQHFKSILATGLSCGMLDYTRYGQPWCPPKQGKKPREMSY